MMPLTRKIVAKNPMKISRTWPPRNPRRGLSGIGLRLLMPQLVVGLMFRFMLGTPEGGLVIGRGAIARVNDRETERRGGALEVILLGGRHRDEHLQRAQVVGHHLDRRIAGADAHDRDLRAL